MLWLLPTVLLMGLPCYPSEAAPLPPPGVVSVSVSRQHGPICLAIHNGTDTLIHYDRKDNRGGKSSLERHALGHLWVGVRYATLGQWWRDLFRVRTLPIIASPPIPSQTTRLHLIPSPLHTFPAGRYRVCFRYRVGRQADWQETCSAPFTQPQ